MNTNDIDNLKRAAAARAVDFVEPGMRLGLGTGSTANHFVELLGDRVRAGLAVTAVASSEATQALAQKLGKDHSHASRAERFGTDDFDRGLTH